MSSRREFIAGTVTGLLAAAAGDWQAALAAIEAPVRSRVALVKGGIPRPGHPHGH